MPGGAIANVSLEPHEAGHGGQHHRRRAVPDRTGAVRRNVQGLDQPDGSAPADFNDLFSVVIALPVHTRLHEPKKKQDSFVKTTLLFF